MSKYNLLYLGAAWIPVPIVDTIAISSIQTPMVISLYNLAPVIVSLAAGYSVSIVCKFFFGVGSIVGGALDAAIASFGTVIIGCLVTLYLLHYVYDGYQLMNKDSLEESIQSFMKSEGFKNTINDLKQLTKNPKNLTNKAITDVIDTNRS
ncbi:unnamed protein product [Adineta ricciae]|uniref:Uncharacterized protein n=1 Tax=Adineta ricciae TaxID=249248 RepID=A0A815ST39_ADIRI|nr:unnamed protein product [Adineta ricciae]